MGNINIMMRTSSKMRVSAVVFITIAVFLFGFAKSKQPYGENVVRTNDDRDDRSLQHERRNEILQQSEVQQIVTPKTVHCPNNNNHEDITKIFFEDYNDQPSVPGRPTKWIVKNNSKDPVVILFVVQDEVGNIATEVSAMNNDFFPPHHDKHAILQPRQSKLLNTFEGHFFHLRKMLPDGNLGPIVMQHRVGFAESAIVKDCDFDNAEIANITQEASSSFPRLSGRIGLRGIR